jgi:hypothetical protein
MFVNDKESPKTINNAFYTVCYQLFAIMAY